MCDELAADGLRLLMRSIATAAVITRELMKGLFFDCVYLVKVSMAGHQNNTAHHQHIHACTCRTSDVSKVASRVRVQKVFEASNIANRPTFG